MEKYEALLVELEEPLFEHHNLSRGLMILHLV
jgi:hypothetical protein